MQNAPQQQPSTSQPPGKIPVEPIIERRSVFPTFKKYPIVLVLLIAVGIISAVLLLNFYLRPTYLPSSEIKKEQLFTLSLESPTDGTLAVNNEILVKGKTTPQTTVMIYTDEDQTSIVSGDQGLFEATITLSSGINTLNVTAFSSDGQEKNISVNILRDGQT